MPRTLLNFESIKKYVKPQAFICQSEAQRKSEKLSLLNLYMEIIKCLKIKCDTYIRVYDNKGINAQLLPLGTNDLLLFLSCT